MGSVGARFETRLGVREVAQVFQAAAAESRGLGSKTGGLFAKMSGRGGDLEFFTPRDDSPFSALEADKEDFGVGVHIPKMSGGGAGAVRTVQMFVWDRGQMREVLLVSPHSAMEGSGARKLVDSFVRSFTTRDSGLRITE